MKNIYKVILAALLSANLFADPQVGSKAVDFSLPGLFDAQKEFKSDDFKGKVVLLNIWASWCGGCKAEMPEFFHLQKEYAQRDFLIVTASIDTKDKKSMDFLRSIEEETGMKTPFVTIWDREKRLSKAYNPKGVPASYLIDKEGKISKVIIGSFDKKGIEELKKDIDALLENGR